MSNRTRLVLTFAGRAIGILIVISLLWGFLLAAPYNRVLVAITDNISGADIVLGEEFDEEDRQQNFLKEDSIVVGIGQPEETYEIYGFIPGSALHYGMLLVISLIVATPGLTWRRRLIFIPIALVIMFIIHLITILIFASVSLSGMNPYPFIILFISLGTGLFPIIVWGVLCYKYWWPRGPVKM